MKSPKNFLIVSLTIILLCSTTVFLAVLNPNDLSVSATNISKEKSNWNVKINSVEVFSINGTVVSDITTFTDSSCKFSHTFSKYGDSITYKVKVKNEGTFDAVLDSSSFTSLDNYKNDVRVDFEEPNQILKSGEEKEFNVSFTYINSVNTLPIKNISKIVIAYNKYN